MCAIFKETITHIFNSLLSFQRLRRVYGDTRTYNRINAISRKAMRRGFILTAFDTDALIDKSNRTLFRQVANPGNSLHHLLPPPKKKLLPADLTSFVRGNIHTCFFPTVQYSQFKNCYINRCLFKYV